MEEPSGDEIRKSNMETLANAHATYVEAIRKSFGEDGLKTIGKANRLHGLRLGEVGLESGGLRRGDLVSIYEFFKSAYPYFGFELTLNKNTNTELELKVTSCPWIKAFKEKGANEDICHWVCKIDEGIGQAVDAKLRMTLPKCMMRGDDYCIYRYQRMQD
jgi:hypothetical protein